MDELGGGARDAASLLAVVAGEDVAEGDDGVFRIVWARIAQTDPDWQARCGADRPAVERKIANFALRLRGDKPARCRGLQRIATDADTRAGAIN